MKENEKGGGKVSQLYLYIIFVVFTDMDVKEIIGFFSFVTQRFAYKREPPQAPTP